VQDSKKKAILLGYSGHAYVAAEAAELLGLELLGYCDKSEAKSNPFGYHYLGDERDLKASVWSLGLPFILGVGDNKVRALIAKRVQEQGEVCLTVVHPNASVSKMAEIGTGSFIARNCAINPLVKIGKNVIINTSAIIDHECEIGDGVHIAPGSVLAGNVKVEAMTFIGANTVIKEGVKIGAGVIVGAGSVILRDVPAGAIIYGNPGKIR